EDIAFKKIVDDYEKASGNTIDYTIVPYAPLRQKIISAVTSGVVPDIYPSTPNELVGLQAWADKLVDVSDVVEPQRELYTDTALSSVNCYNGVEKRRSIYGVPLAQAVFTNHVWRPLVEKAGYQMSDLPKTWDAYYDFFKDVQKKLRNQGMRHIYGLGFQLTTQGNDPNALFAYFVIAYGGQDLVTKDGRMHADDPKVREAVLKTLIYPTTAYKEGFVPSGAINWNDADDNNAFHSKQIVMDLDGTISTEVAMFADKQDYDDIVTMGLPLSNDGKPVPSQALFGCALIPKGAKNIAAAKDFLKYLSQPKVNGEYLKVGLGRNTPPMPSIVKADPWWSADPHRKAYIEQAVMGPTLPQYWVYNPAWAEVQNQHVWGAAWADVIQHGLSPEAAADKAFKWTEAIFAKYPIAQS
ncbi:MAG: extracellular solute-binding protein, partial [Acidobacteria bacterium]|nr:extracellular solute-binding protein [Acidobacteriota bacterium]